MARLNVSPTVAIIDPCPAACPSRARCKRLVDRVGLDLCDAGLVPLRALAAWPITPAARPAASF